MTFVAFIIDTTNGDRKNALSEAWSAQLLSELTHSPAWDTSCMWLVRGSRCLHRLSCVTPCYQWKTKPNTHHLTWPHTCTEVRIEEHDIQRTSQSYLICHLKTTADYRKWNKFRFCLSQYQVIFTWSTDQIFPVISLSLWLEVVSA